MKSKNNEDIIFVGLLKDCAKQKDFGQGIRVYAEILKRGLLGRSPFLGNLLINMCAKCGVLSKAEEVFEDLPARDTVAWNSLIAGYAQQGQSQAAISCFEMMQIEGLFPDSVTYICLLKACANSESLDIGREIHEEIMCKRLLEKDIILGTSLVDMYAKCGELAKARRVFEDIPIRNIASWNALITGYAEQGLCFEALDCFERLQSEGLSPTTVTFISILKAFGKRGFIEGGRKIHDVIASCQLLEKDIVLGTALVDMYAKCGAPAKGEEVLEQLPLRNVVSWSALISGYAEQQQGCEALRCFECMRKEGILPNMVTYICVLKGCGSIGAVEKGKMIHYEVISRGMLMKDVALGTALVDTYARCGLLDEAQQILQMLSIRNVVTWSALIAGYAEQGQGKEALFCLDQMRTDGLSPDAITYICVLKACGSTGAIDKGKQIHDMIISGGYLEKEIVLGTALVDMYSKCGMLANAKQVLKGLPSRNVVIWNALILGYAQQGEGYEALVCFDQMQSEKVRPDKVTVLGILTACSHSGLLDEAQIVFHNMSEKYGITPNLEHSTCMMMIFGSAGHFDKAVSVINALPSSDCPDVWLGLLGACGKWGNVKVGRLCFDQIMQSDNSCAAAYVLMANLFAAAGLKNDANKVEAMRLKYAASEHNLWVHASGEIGFGDGNNSLEDRFYAKMKCVVKLSS